MDIYLAAPIFTTEQRDVVDLLKAYAEGAGHEVFSPYHNSSQIFQGLKPSEASQEERNMVLADNIRYIDWCDCLLAWVGGMGGFTDPGVVWELGYAFAKTKFILAYIDDDEKRQSMNLMLAGTIDAMVVGQQQVGQALYMLPTDPKKKVVEKFHPSRHLHEDMKPVV